MNFNEFEERLKQNIYNDTADIDTEALWNRIQKKDRKCRPLWFILFGMLTAGLLLSVYLFSKVDQAPSLNASSDNATIITEKDANLLPSSSVKNEQNSANLELNEPRSPGNIKDNNEEVISRIEKSTINEDNILEQKTESSLTAQNNFIDNEIAKRIGSSKSGREQREVISVNRQSVSSDSGQSKNRVHVASKAMSEERLDAGINAPEMLSKLPRILPELLFKNSSTEFQNIDTIDIVSRDRNKFDGSERAIWIGISGGADLINRSISKNAMSDPLKWGLTDEHLESVMIMNAGLELGVELSRRVYLRSGLAYNRLIERVAHSWATSRQITLQGALVEERLTSNGLIQINEDVQVTETRSFQLEQYNSVNYLEVPLGLGVRSLSGGKKMWFSAELGALFAFNITQEGSVFKTDVDLISLEEQSTLKSNFGTGIYGRINLHRELTNNLDAYLSMRSRTYLNPLSNEDYAYNVRYVLLGSQIGIQYRLR